jgi:predicted KAP-like P-loop ATPase
VEEIQKAAEAISRETKSYHRRQLQYMEEFEATFKEAVSLLDEKGRGRLIVFVDDLDRCLPEKALEVLEAIKLFLEVPGVIFILGMDQDVIRQGIEARYAAAFRRPGQRGGTAGAAHSRGQLPAKNCANPLPSALPGR